VPLVTCRGGAFPGRVAASLLHAIGLPELITENLPQYQALALDLAHDPGRLKDLRRKLEAGRHASPLFDTDRFCRHIEAAYAKMWEICLSGDRPRGFAVPPMDKTP
jgi:predicted O-linked N-acetylglucosamine transferase (SPINDLY family)